MQEDTPIIDKIIVTKPRGLSRKKKIWLLAIANVLLIGAGVAFAILSKNEPEIKPSLSCDDGYELRDENCISQEAVDTSKQFCRLGELIDDACVATEKADLVKNCPANSVEQGSQCLETTVKPALVRQFCPSGSIERDGECFVFIGGKTCPAGVYKERFWINRMRCYMARREITDPSSDGCVGVNSPEMINEGNYCYYDAADQFCRPDAVEIDGKCYTKQSKAQESYCETSYVLDSGNCKMTRKLDKSISCPAEFTLEADTCVKKITSKPEVDLNCVGVGLVEVDRKCYRQKIASKVCPENYKVEGDKCVKDN